VSAPKEIVKEVFPTDAVRAGGGIDSCFAAFDEASQIVHFILRIRDSSMPDRRTDYQPG
jgi:hypothetical protein